MRDIQEFKPGLYKHYKGGFYIALFLVRHHETGDFLVVYTSSKDHTVSVREWDSQGKDSWCDEVEDRWASPNKRFTYMGPAL